MFGTIRKHQQWLWVIIIAGVIFSFVIFFGPAQPSLSDLTGGGESFGTLNGKPLTRETLGGFARQAQLAGSATRWIRRRCARWASTSTARCTSVSSWTPR